MITNHFKKAPEDDKIRKKTNRAFSEQAQNPDLMESKL